jgi:RNA polymerase sigma-70 factor (sigma-E family)
MERAGTPLLRLAWLLTGDADRAQELTQAALVKTYVAWPRVREGEELAYARRVLVNHSTDTWRSTRREQAAQVVPEPATASDDMAASDNRDLVVRLLRQLPVHQRKVVVLRYYADLTETATAEALGVSVGAVKSAASRGLAALRTALRSGSEIPERPGPRPGPDPAMTTGQAGKGAGHDLDT